jgi:hypothetical protein
MCRVEQAFAATESHQAQQEKSKARCVESAHSSLPTLPIILVAFALTCEDAVDDGAGLGCGVLAAITEVKLVTNKSASIAAPM